MKGSPTVTTHATLHSLDPKVLDVVELRATHSNRPLHKFTHSVCLFLEELNVLSLFLSAYCKTKDKMNQGMLCFRKYSFGLDSSQNMSFTRTSRYSMTQCTKSSKSPSVQLKQDSRTKNNSVHLFLPITLSSIHLHDMFSIQIFQRVWTWIVLTSSIRLHKCINGPDSICLCQTNSRGTLGLKTIVKP